MGRLLLAPLLLGLVLLPSPPPLPQAPQLANLWRQTEQRQAGRQFLPHRPLLSHPEHPSRRTSRPPPPAAEHQLHRRCCPCGLLGVSLSGCVICVLNCSLYLLWRELLAEAIGLLNLVRLLIEERYPLLACC